jgi:hypothetical protein
LLAHLLELLRLVEVAYHIYKVVSSSCKVTFSLFVDLINSFSVVTKLPGFFLIFSISYEKLHSGAYKVMYLCYKVFHRNVFAKLLF